MAECVSGCVVSGEHLGTCVDASCRGCAPAAAAVGVLCSRCWSRLQSEVRTLPSLVEALVSGEGRGSASSSGVRVPPGPRDLFEECLEVADDLFSVLVEWGQGLAEHLGERFPDVGGIWWSESTVRQDAESGEWYRVDPVPLGLRDVSAARSVVSWFEPRLEAAAEWWGVGDMLADLSRLSSRARARWQMEEAERRVSDIACPKCSARSLIVHPPRVVGAEEQVVCSRPACGAVLSVEDWKRLRAWAVVVARMGGS